MDLNNIILLLFLTAFGLFYFAIFLKIFKKNKLKILIDNQFNKPQAFHNTAIPIAGGLGIYISFVFVIINFMIFEEVFFLEYFTICSLFFLLGFVDDIRINIKPTIRLFLMILVLVFLVNYNDFYIEKTGIEILNHWLENSKFFSLLFISLCFLFVINGANLIDGYNGHLGIHTLIILTNLFFINYFNENNDFANFLFFGILTIIIFLIFNFPRAKVFLGDSGSYFLGAFIAVSTIKTSFLNPEISPFYFCILLFYLFFEVFFSFFRKLIKEKKSPIHPDSKHLHMILYKFLLKKNKDKFKSNFYVSIIINMIYLFLIFPAIFMMNNGMFCKYYSIIFFIIYIFSYKKIKQTL